MSNQNISKPIACMLNLRNNSISMFADNNLILISPLISFVTLISVSLAVDPIGVDKYLQLVFASYDVTFLSTSETPEP